MPRFYGVSVAEVFASAVTEDEARLAVGRARGFPSWELLLESVASSTGNLHGEAQVDPMRLAAVAIDAGDLDALRGVVEAHPELLDPPEHLTERGYRLLAKVVHHERRKGVEALRPIRDWLESKGLDYQLELNRQLCGHPRMSADKVRWLLESGADANWVAPNGVPVLEHALIRYWNGHAVDLVAQHTNARPALWITAGMGNVHDLHNWFDRNGGLTDAARRHRPPFDLVGPTTIPLHPQAEDEELLMEAFVVATLNGRTAVLESLVARGFPLNNLVWGSPVVHTAVGNGWTPVVECLVRLGADLDLRGWRPEQSAREIAREMLASMPHDPDRRRIAALCGLDPDAAPAEDDAAD